MPRWFVLIFPVAIAIVVLTVAPLASIVAQSTESADVTMTATEFAFDSSQTEFTAGQTYRFVVTNRGDIAHDWMILARGEEDEEMALIAEEDVAPGATVTREFTFSEPGDFEFACHIQDHYEAGMVLPITVN